MAKALQKVLLITGATGGQGGAVIDALLRSSRASEFTILGVTRDPASRSAQKLASKWSQIKLVKGDLADIPALFAEAKKATSQPIWGVYSVQTFMGKGQTTDTEAAYGKGLVDAAKAAGVKHFVYGSVDRGGEQRSWENPTNVPHFASKHEIELHLRDNAGSAMGWSIVRPVAYMENMVQNAGVKMFLTLVKSYLGDHKTLQYVAVKDIGAASAQAFLEPDRFNHRAVGVAGDELTVPQIADISEKVLGYRLKPTFTFVGSLMGFAMPSDLSHMFAWFRDEGYGVDIAKLRTEIPHVTDMGEWLENYSGLEKRKA